MKERGFTLIELLAVIVILAIIALIATPVILGIINNAKEESDKRSIEMYAKAIENAVVTHQLTKNENIAGSFNTTDGENLILIGETEPKLTIDYNGNVVCNTIEIYADGTLYLANCKVNKEEVETIYGNKASFATDDWGTILSNIKAGYMYEVGQTREISLTGFTNEEKDENGNNIGTYTIRIANKTNAGDVCTKEYLEKEDGKKETYSKTACGFVIEFVDIITKHNMNPVGEYKGVQYDNGWNVDGYPASSMYAYIKNDIYNALPKELKDIIIDTTVVSSHGITSGETNFVSTDKLYLLSTQEILEQGTSKTINNDTARKLTRQLDYYKYYKNTDESIGVTTSNYSGAIKKYNGNAWSWWLRSAPSFNTKYFYFVNNHGSWNYTSAYNEVGVAVAFRLG